MLIRGQHHPLRTPRKPCWIILQRAVPIKEHTQTSPRKVIQTLYLSLKSNAQTAQSPGARGASCAFSSIRTCPTKRTFTLSQPCQKHGRHGPRTPPNKSCLTCARGPKEPHANWSTAQLPPGKPKQSQGNISFTTIVRVCHH